MTQRSDLEERLAARALGVAAAPPDAALTAMARHVADTVGVAIAGSTAPAVGAVRAAHAGVGHAAAGHGAARLLGSGAAAAPDVAALVNGMAAHFHDFDDDDPLVVVGHPSAPVVMAALAAGNGRGVQGQGVQGRALLGACLAGVETVFRLGWMVNPGHYNAGWHATATLGVFGATVASAALMGLPPPVLAQALRLAAAHACGLKASFGSDAKPLQVGRAAQAGYLCAAYAAAGVTGGDGALLGPMGFLAMHRNTAGPLPAAEGIAAFGEPFGILSPGFSIKRHPCCSSSHTAIDALLELTRVHGFGPSDVEEITVAVGPDVPGILIHDRPRTGLEAKFSLRHPLAVALVRGRVSIADFDDAALSRPELVEVAQRVRVAVDPALPRHPTGVTHTSRVRVLLRDGTALERSLDTPVGGAGHPLGDDDLRAKFMDCAAPVIGGEAARSAFAALLDLPGGATLDAVMDAAAPAGGGA